MWNKLGWSKMWILKTIIRRRDCFSRNTRRDGMYKWNFNANFGNEFYNNYSTSHHRYTVFAVCGSIWVIFFSRSLLNRCYREGSNVWPRWQNQYPGNRNRWEEGGTKRYVTPSSRCRGPKKSSSCPPHPEVHADGGDVVAAQEHVVPETDQQASLPDSRIAEHHHLEEVNKKKSQNNVTSVWTHRKLLTK